MNTPSPEHCARLPPPSLHMHPEHHGVDGTVYTAPSSAILSSGVGTGMMPSALGICVRYLHMPPRVQHILSPLQGKQSVSPCAAPDRTDAPSRMQHLDPTHDVCRR
ncbi:hypothetical protein BC826DRAFT_480126 [Russula brevipes]|nr:hypothetical protein BC826DRAFT_480126 [Russula brevipes]